MFYLTRIQVHVTADKTFRVKPGIKIHVNAAVSVTVLATYNRNLRASLQVYRSTDELIS